MTDGCGIAANLVKISASLAVLCAALLVHSCGYKVSGRADLLPRRIQTIAVPAFGNATSRYRLPDRLAEAITREFIQRTRYRIVADPDTADAVLTGAVVNYAAFPTVFDPLTGRATGVQTLVVLQISLTDRQTGQVLFTRPAMDIRERYELSVDPKEFFDESSVAMERLSRDAARTVVSAILENF
jgi:hypothetical protein